jgi:hypothetical protein
MRAATDATLVISPVSIDQINNSFTNCPECFIPETSTLFKYHTIAAAIITSIPAPTLKLVVISHPHSLCKLKLLSGSRGTSANDW